MANQIGRSFSRLFGHSRRCSAVMTRCWTEFSQRDRLTTNGVTRNCSSITAKPVAQKETVTIYFVLADGKRKAAKAKLGDSLLDVVLENNLDINGYGACEGTLACSTCHIIFKENNFRRITGRPTDEELDMLDLAFGLSDTSRLGCQITVTKDMEGWEVTVPAGFADARS